MTTRSDILGTFTDHQTGRNLAPATIRRRAVTIRAFARFLAPATLHDATPELADEFVHAYRSPATRRSYRADLNAFYRWATRRHLTTCNPMDDTDPIKVPKTLPRPVDPNALDHLIASTGDWEVATAIALAAYAGLRCSEICAIDRTDLSFATTPAVLIVRDGKGGKDRAVPVHPTLARILTGRPAGRLVNVLPDTIGKKVAAHLRTNGINATLHQLRHTFGTEAARASNGNLLVVAGLMGHESTATTAGYTKLVGVDTAATVGAMYPNAA